MKKYLIILSAFATMALFGCEKADGDPITKEFSVNGAYTALNVEDEFDVSFSDEVSQVTITAGDKIMTKVRVELVADELKIYLKGWSVSYGKMTVLLPRNPNLNSLNLSGSSSFNGDLAAEEVDLELSGASKFTGSVVANELDVDLSGASEVTIDGQAVTLDLDLSGSSSIKKKVVNDRYSLACTLCKGHISGSSSVYIHCDGSIKVDLSGSSNLHFTGEAYTYGSQTSGSSDIIHDEF